MQSPWYYSAYGKSLGPFSEEEILAIFHHPGGPGSKALVFNKEATGEAWIYAEEIPGLLPDFPQPISASGPETPVPLPSPEPQAIDVVPESQPVPSHPQKRPSLTWFRKLAIAFLLLAVACIGGVIIRQHHAASKTKSPVAIVTEQLGQAETTEAKPQVEFVIKPWPSETNDAGTKHQSEVATAPSRTVLLGDGISLELVRCEAGTFTMGSPTDEAGRGIGETPHQVTLTKPFWLGKTEVAQAQWKALMRDNPSEFKGNDLPVENVSWCDAMSFCNKLTEREADRIPAGYEYRLPTEAEWEYACRAGSSGPYAGNGKADDLGWYKSNSDKKTHPVKQKQPNGWGLYDMHGNVSEWCYDCSDISSESTVTDPVGEPSVSRKSSSRILRVYRGGCWCSVIGCYRAAFRCWDFQDSRCNYVGFRVALAPVVSALRRQDQDAKSKTISLTNGVKLELLHCPDGTFMMGSPVDEANRRDNEPLHRVILTNPFWIGKTEVTQSQWMTVMGNNPSKHQGGDLPVEMVSWNDAMAFCARLNEYAKKTGKLPNGYEYRLPTEAEWEYACRAGTNTPYAGFTSPKDLGWYTDNSGGQTHPVGQKQPNAWGLYDMRGNVWEWCQDKGGSYPATAVINPIGFEGGNPVLRGASWGSVADYCRSALRHGGGVTYVERDVGFRIVLAPIIYKR
jgi:formylglycine-generating enzyme required for sulfatase activity